ncbi:MAG: CAP domain-containing protein [Deltaproteobacteria bacterium]|nr:CAP domain-containing protein [Deltaproteobacteria bacterium]
MKIQLRIVLGIFLIIVVGCAPFAPSTEVARDYRISPLEKEIVREINLARTNPRKYASFLEERKKYYDGKLFYRSDETILRTKEGVSAVNESIRFLRNANQLPPLSISRGMSLGAKDHVRDIGPRGATRHKGSDGSKPSDRINRYGIWQGEMGENIFYGGNEARDIVMGLIIDDGVSSRGHRKNIFNPYFRVVGVGCGYHHKYRTLCVITFANGYIEP